MSLSKEEQQEFDQLLAEEEKAKQEGGATGSEEQTPADANTDGTDESAGNTEQDNTGNDASEETPDQKSETSEDSQSTTDQKPDAPVAPTEPVLSKVQQRKAAMERIQKANAQINDVKNQQTSTQTQEPPAATPEPAVVEPPVEVKTAPAKTDDPFVTNPNLAFLKRSLTHYCRVLGAGAVVTPDIVVNEHNTLLKVLKQMLTKFPEEDFKPALRFVNQTIRDNLNGAFSPAMIARGSNRVPKEFIHITQALITLATAGSNGRRHIYARFDYAKYFGVAAGRVHEFYRNFGA